MKKILVFMTSALLLLAGCAKETFTGPDGEGGLQNVTFTASVAGQATKAAFDNDGNGAYVNRCIMEIYYGDELFSRQYAKVTAGQASFTTQLVSGRTYDVAFWADHVDATTESGLQVDKYYNTRSDDGLKAVSLKGYYIGNIDARDAFALCKKYTVSQQGGSFNAVLKRPFAQINVITTDVATVAKVAALKPDKVTLTIHDAVNTYNVVDSTAVSGATADLAYYVATSIYSWNADTTACTLSMDYIFAENTKQLIDIDWTAIKSGNTDVSHTFSSIPYQRNYRTNIKGALLTTTGQWNVTVDPIWYTPEYNFIVAAATVMDIDGMNTFVADNPQATQYDVTFSQVPNDAGTPGVDEGAHAVLTTPLSTNDIMNVAVESDTKTLYVGDYENQNSTTLTTGTTNAATVNINIPAGKKIETLVINAPSKSVYLNGALVESVGTLTNVEATTSAHTLVVEANQSITGKLIVRQGGLEIHGSVAALGIRENDHDNNPVKVRKCENLSKAVFDTIYVAGDHDYIDRPTYVEKKNDTTPVTWDIIKAVCITGTVDDPIGGYATLEDAFANVAANGTITLLEDVTTSSEILVDKTVTLDLNGHSINSDTHSAFQINGGKLTVDGEGTISGAPSNYKEIYLKGSTDASAYNYSVFTLRSGAKVSCSTGYAIMVSANEGVAYGTRITIYGEAEGYYGALYVNGTIQATTGNVPVISIYGTLKTNDESAALYAAGYAKYYIYTDASLTGNNAAYISSGAVTITGGTFTATGAASEYVAAPSGYNTTGDAIVIDTRDGYAPHSVTIKGGYFSSENNKAIGIYPADAADKGFISGGYFSTAPADALVADTYGVVDNTATATRDTYPYTIAKAKLVGSGTVSDPYQVGSAEDLKLLNSSGYYSNFLLTQDIVTTGEEFTSSQKLGKVLIQQISGTFDGGGHTIRFPEGTSSYAICNVLYNGTIKNLKVEFPEEGTVSFYAYNGSRFENVDVSGKLLHFSGNCGAYCIYDFYDVTFIDCDCSADITGKGGKGDYNAVFVGYVNNDGDALTFQNCTYSGKMVCGRSAMFVGNPCTRNITMNVENCTNAGTIISTYVASGYKMNYYTAISDEDGSNNYDSFVLNGTSHPGMSADNSWVPLCWEDDLVTTTGQAVNGPEQTGMVFQRGGDNQFIITPATDGKIQGTTVHHYVVSTGLYVGLEGQGGSSRQYATETITPDGSASYTTTMKDFQFVDRTYVGSGEIVKIGDNNTYTDDDGTYYVVASGYTTGDHQPESATLYNLSAFDANGVLLATANLTE